MSMVTKPPPPRGYTNWLDYAVATMDLRAAQLEASGLFDDFVDGPLPSYNDMRAAANAELQALRTSQSAP